MRAVGAIWLGSSIQRRSHAASRRPAGFVGAIELGADPAALAVHRMAAAAVDAELAEAACAAGGALAGGATCGKRSRAADQLDAHELVRPAVVALGAHLRVGEVLPDQVERRERDVLEPPRLELVDREHRRPRARTRATRGAPSTRATGTLG